MHKDVDHERFNTAYRTTYHQIVDHIVKTFDNRARPKTKLKTKPKPLAREYEEGLTKALGEALAEIDIQIASIESPLSIRRAVIQFNSVHPKINKRLRLPWKFHDKPLPKAPAELLYLRPDLPISILTELWLRLDPSKGWCGILRKPDGYETLLRAAKRKQAYLCHAEWSERRDRSSLPRFRTQIRNEMQKWRNRKTNPPPLVGLAEPYPNDSSFDDVVRRVWEKFKLVRPAHNVFYLADLVLNQQLAGISAELVLPPGDKVKLHDIRTFLSTCQWLLNRFVFEPILQAERSYSGEGPSYPKAHFWSPSTQANPEPEHYEMVESLIKIFTPYDLKRRHRDEFSKRYTNKPLNKSATTEALFRKLRGHCEIAQGDMGRLAIGYNRHAYEVACVVGAIMDVLFYGDKSTIESIVRRRAPGLEGIDELLEAANVPFLFRQLFRGLSKEDQLFLIPQYREHFIHSFYVFTIGVALMAYGPSGVVPEKLQIRNKKESDIKDILKSWFLVSMWHDVAYMIEKGNLVLEQHVLSLMNRGRRDKGVLPWLPSLGHLMQVENVLNEIRELSRDAIALPAVEDEIRDKQLRHRLRGDVVVATAFERRDHGIWSALVMNHAWDQRMAQVYFGKKIPKKRWSDYSSPTRSKIARAIIPHHLCEWDVIGILRDHDAIKSLKRPLSGMCLSATQLATSIKNRKPVKRGQVGCKSLAASLPAKGNELGYLLGICDVLSQAGRENAEVPEERSKKLGIKYTNISANTRGSGSLDIDLKYVDSKISQALFIERFKVPAIFFGMAFGRINRTGEEVLRITIESELDNKNATALFWHPDLVEANASGI